MFIFICNKKCISFYIKIRQKAYRSHNVWSWRRNDKMDLPSGRSSVDRTLGVHLEVLGSIRASDHSEWEFSSITPGMMVPWTHVLVDSFNHPPLSLGLGLRCLKDVINSMQDGPMKQPRIVNVYNLCTYETLLIGNAKLMNWTQ